MLLKPSSTMSRSQSNERSLKVYIVRYIYTLDTPCFKTPNKHFLSTVFWKFCLVKQQSSNDAHLKRYFIDNTKLIKGTPHEIVSSNCYNFLIEIKQTSLENFIAIVRLFLVIRIFGKLVYSQNIS